MEYEPEFVKSFMRRTSAIIEEYKGPHDATMLVNCLLGLLVVPKESLLDKIPDEPFDTLSSWGIEPRSITNFGQCDYGHQHEPTLRQLVRRLRNAVAHFNIEPIHSDGVVSGFRFTDRKGFRAEIPLSELREFSIRLAKYLEENA